MPKIVSVERHQLLDDAGKEAARITIQESVATLQTATQVLTLPVDSLDGLAALLSAAGSGPAASTVELTPAEAATNVDPAEATRASA